MIYVQNDLPRPDAALGFLRAEGVHAGPAGDAFDGVLAELLTRRAAPLTDEEERRRQAARELLRNGRYRPTGRGKPASEYLLRAAQTAAFPRINAPVDVCNYISLLELVPVSLWDLDLAGAERFCFRLGRADEAYVFNTAGQTIALEDLVVGCRVPAGGAGEPVVTPVKDSLATKTTPATTRVAACLYAPAPPMGRAAVEAACTRFARMLREHAGATSVAWRVLLPGEAAAV